MELRKRARARRKEMGLTQAQVAERAGISPRSYQSFEAGTSTPQGPNLGSILRALEMEDAALDGQTAETTREEWPDDVRVFLDMMGAYLARLDLETRLRSMHNVTRRIFDGS